MKKLGVWLVGLLVLLGGIVGGTALAMQRQIRQDTERLDAVPVVALSDVADGTYEGIAETGLVRVTVLVTVSGHRLTGIELTRHENGKGTPAEAMLPEMLRQNTSEVDTITGATMSSKCIRAAVRSALAEGTR